MRKLASTYNILLILSLILVSSAYSLNAIHDARYQFYPEIFKANQGAVGVGINSHFNGDVIVPAFFKFGLNKVELGGKISHSRYNTLSDGNTVGDIGLKIKISNYQSIQTDVIFGIGTHGYEGVAVSYNALRKYSTKIYSMFDGRIAFFDGLKGGNPGLFAQELGAYPELRLSNKFKLILGFAESFTVGYFDTIKNTFSLDMIPRIQYHTGPPNFFFDFTMGIQGPEESNFRYALYFTIDI